MSTKSNRHGFGFDRLVGSITAIVSVGLGFWTDYWIVTLIVLAAYFAGGVSFAWWDENVDKHG